MDKKTEKIIHLHPEQGETKKKNLGYRIGTLFAAICQLCLLAVIVALTTKFIVWLF